MKLYIAGPMSGIPEYNYPRFFDAEKELSAIGYEVLNPANNEEHHDGEPFSMEKTWYMRRAFRMLAEADGVALLPGWWYSVGASLEEHIARSMGLEVKPLSVWLENHG